MLSSVYSYDYPAFLKYLQKENNINRQDALGETALMKACLNNRVQIVQALLEKGANVNLVDKQGRTALMFAVYGSICSAPDVELDLEQPQELFKVVDMRILEALMGTDVDITLVDRQGQDALLIAKKTGNERVFRYLSEQKTWLLKMEKLRRPTKSVDSLFLAVLTNQYK